MDVDDTMDKHWALRMLRLQLTVPAGGKEDGEEDGEESGEESGAHGTDSTTSMAAQALFALASHAEDGRLGVSDVVEFCLGPLLVSPVVGWHHHCLGCIITVGRLLCVRC